MSYRSFVLIGAFLLLGCSTKQDDRWTKDRKPTFPVAGAVTYKGEVVEGAVITFRSAAHSIAATGRTDKEGKFTLKTYEDGDGAIEGDHKVTVAKTEIKYPDGVDPDEFNGEPKEVWHLPKKYSSFEESGLTATVKADGENRFEFDLQD